MADAYKVKLKDWRKERVAAMVAVLEARCTNASAIIGTLHQTAELMLDAAEQVTRPRPDRCEEVREDIQCVREYAHHSRHRFYVEEID